MEHSRSLWPSNLYRFYLLFTFIFDMVQSRTLLLISVSWPLGLVFTASTSLKGIILLLESYPKTQWISARQIGHKSRIGMYSIATYAWLNSLIRSGSRKTLDVGDLYSLDPDMASDLLDRKFWATWTKTISRGKRTHLLVALARAMTWELLAPIPPRLGKILFDFGQPFLIRAIQKYLSKPRAAEPTQESIILIGATALIYLGRAFSTGIYQYFNLKATISLRGFLINGIYRQTLVSGAAAGDGKASVTLMSTDVERIQAISRSMHEFWANTIEVALGAYFLYLELGLASLVPISIVFLCFLGILVVGKVTPSLHKQWVAATQERISATASAIANMNGLKVLGLEKKMGDIIQSMREAEIKAGASFRRTTIFAAIFALTPLMLSPVLTFAATSQNVDTTTAFTSLSFLILLTNPLGNLFQLLPTYIAAMACFDRIAAYLGAATRFDYRMYGVKKLPNGTLSTAKEEFELGHIESARPVMHTEAFLIEDGFFGWEEGQNVLNKINLVIPTYQLTIVTGPVGCGKSTLCKALLGEVPYVKGNVFSSLKPLKIGFCDQPPFLPNVSVQEVIVGGEKFEKAWYRQVVDAAELWPDIETFAHRDQTFVGPNGSNLSGGQRQRVAIARALYAKPAVLIFDDIFSGLDVFTEEVIVAKVLGPEGLLRQLGATVVLCTHAVRYLPLADNVVILGADGTVAEQGTYEMLKTRQNHHYYLQKQGIVSRESDAQSMGQVVEYAVASGAGSLELDGNGKRFGDLAAYKQYLSVFGRLPLTLFIVLSLISASCTNFSIIWLKIWSEYSTQHPLDKTKNLFYLGIYATIQILGLISVSLAITTTNIILVKRTGKAFHLQALRTLMSAPLHLFSKFPPGVFLSRFAQDLNIVDTELELHFADLGFCVAISIGMAVIIATASPYVAVLYPVLVMALYLLQHFYLRTSRQLRFLDLETKSPLLYAIPAPTLPLLPLNLPPLGNLSLKASPGGSLLVIIPAVAN